MAKLNITGAKELQALLNDLADDALAVKSVRAASVEAAQHTVEQAFIDYAPDDSGRLKTFIGHATKLKNGMVNVYVGVLRMSKRKFERSGLKSGAYYARYTNDGTKFQRAQHWAERAAESQAQPYVDAFTTLCETRVRKAVEKNSRTKL